MSLFGTGRKEGVAAVCLIGLLVGLAHLAAGYRGGTVDAPARLTAVAGAIGGMLAYRFLRVQGRSRYAGFLAGAGYGLAPLLAGLSLLPRELLAAALAPLALEAVGHCDRPSRRRRWLPWIGLLLALPFVWGATVVASLTAALAICGFVRTIVYGDHSEEGPPLRAMAVGVVLGVLAASNLIWLDPFAAWLGPPSAATTQQVLEGRLVTQPELTPAIVVRALGPVLIWFAAFGVLRRQRQVFWPGWLLLALLGAAPTAMLLTPALQDHVPFAAAAPGLPAAACWLCLLAVTVLGAAGLDDFLDMPQRRRSAFYVVLAITLLGAPLWGLWDPTGTSDRLWIVLATWVALALAATTWRRLGILRFKNVLTSLALVAFAVPVVVPVDLTPTVPPAPLGEIGVTTWSMWWELLRARPFWHFAGLAATFAITLAMAACAMRPRRSA